MADQRGVLRRRLVQDGVGPPTQPVEHVTGAPRSQVVGYLSGLSLKDAVVPNDQSVVALFDNVKLLFARFTAIREEVSDG